MILVIDNYDSFTYNLVQYLGVCGEKARVVRNDEVSLSEIEDLKPSGVLLSPGPCTPHESGVCLDVIRATLGSQSTLHGVPLFGVCLGHQGIGLVAGGTVARAENIRHGKASMIEHDGKGLLAGLPEPFRAIRYHSLIVKEDSLPPEFLVTSRSMDDGEVMGIRHRELPIEGVQFHPESVLTDCGMTIVENFVRQVNEAR